MSAQGVLVLRFFSPFWYTATALIELFAVLAERTFSLVPFFFYSQRNGHYPQKWVKVTLHDVPLQICQYIPRILQS